MTSNRAPDLFSYIESIKDNPPREDEVHAILETIFKEYPLQKEIFNKYHQTPLMLAVKYGLYDVFTFLYRINGLYWPEFKAKDNMNKTIYEYATSFADQDGEEKQSQKDLAKRDIINFFVNRLGKSSKEFKIMMREAIQANNLYFFGRVLKLTLIKLAEKKKEFVPSGCFDSSDSEREGREMAEYNHRQNLASTELKLGNVFVKAAIKAKNTVVANKVIQLYAEHLKNLENLIQRALKVDLIEVAFNLTSLAGKVDFRLFLNSIHSLRQKKEKDDNALRDIILSLNVINKTQTTQLDVKDIILAINLAENNDYNVLKLFLSNFKAPAFDRNIIDAALESGRIDIVKYCLAFDSKCDVQYALQKSITLGNKKFVKELLANYLHRLKLPNIRKPTDEKLINTTDEKLLLDRYILACFAINDNQEQEARLYCQKLLDADKVALYNLFSDETSKQPLLDKLGLKRIALEQQCIRNTATEVKNTPSAVTSTFSFVREFKKDYAVSGEDKKDSKNVSSQESERVFLEKLLQMAKQDSAVWRSDPDMQKRLEEFCLRNLDKNFDSGLQRALALSLR